MYFKKAGKLAIMVLIGSFFVPVLCKSYVFANVHDHIAIEPSVEWQRILSIATRLLEVFSIMLLVGSFFFRSYLWPTAQETNERAWIWRTERIAVTAALYVFMITGEVDAVTFVRVVITIAWLLMVFEWTRTPVVHKWLKSIFSIILIVTFIAGETPPTVTYQSSMMVAAHLLNSLGGVIWFGGGLGLMISSGKRSPLSLGQLNALTARFISYASFALLFLIFSCMMFVIDNTKSWTEFSSSLASQLIALQLFLTLVIACIAYFQYKSWVRGRKSDQLGDKEGEARRLQMISFRQGVRLNLSLLSVVFIFSSIASATDSTKTSGAEPVYWHVMGAEAHMSLRINNAKQQIRLDVWLPPDLGEPAEVEVELVKEDVSIKVPLTYREGGPDPYGYDDFDKYTYEAVGYYLESTGIWTLKVEVSDVNGRVYPFEKIELVN